MSTTFRVTFLAAMLFVACLAAFAGVTTLVSVAGDGTQGNLYRSRLFGHGFSSCRCQ